MAAQTGLGIVLLMCVCLLMTDRIHSSEYKVLFQDFPSNVLQRHIKVSRHSPFCVLFRSSGKGSKLEKLTYDLWQNKNAANYTGWKFGSFNPESTKMPAKNPKPERLPALRCYLGESSAYQYENKVKKPLLESWFDKLSSLYVEQSEEVSVSRIQELQRTYRILLLAFPDGPRHHEVEDMVYFVADEFDSCKALAVHLTSPEVTNLRQTYGVNRYPSVVVIHNTVSNGTVSEDFQVFWGQEVNRHVLKIYIEAQSIAAPFLNMDSFQGLLHDTGKPGWQFQPVLICFYAHWAKDIHGYLYAFNETVIQYKADLVQMRFGVLDLGRHWTKKIVSKYLKTGAMKFVPFLVLFYKDSNNDIHHRVLHIGRPYPWVMYQPLADLDIDIIDTAQIEPYPDPFNVITFDQFSSIREGPNGTLCYSWSHNLTDNTPYIRPAPVVKKRSIIKKPTIVEEKKEKTWHDLFDMDSLERKLAVHSGIPLVTKETWQDIIEKSHAPRHIFYKAGRWAGEVTKVSLVVFIMADCGNCRRNNQTFLDIKKAVAHIDGGAMYYVNCTAEPVLCRNHNIRGFPTIAAYRGLGWMDVSSCVTRNNQKLFNKYVRVDYHGVIKADMVLEWYSRTASNSITNLKHGETLGLLQDKEVRLVSMVVPMWEVSGPAWNYKCLRLLCERLYSVTECYSIQQTTASGEETDMAVIQVRFERKDGVKTVIMKHGTSLLEMLEKPDDTRLHMYHQPHSYNISGTGTCEEDNSVCTEIITEFILDHSRLPVTPLTSDLFHTSTSLLKEDNLPILLALAHTENLTMSSNFTKELRSAAYELYSDIKVMTLDVTKYSVWATKFVPSLYGHTRVFSDSADPDDPDPLSLYTYPRLVIVRKSDHHHAAFYPPVTRPRRKKEEFSGEVILEFVQSYLQDPNSVIVQTEHF